MREAFREPNFHKASLEKIRQMVAIIGEYQAQGLRLTARQLYYQFVARDFIRNTQKEYKNLTRLLTDARYAGLVDWNAIEDRGRVPDVPSEWGSIRSLVNSALRAFRLPRWDGQEAYVELWVEKQALAGVLEPLASQFHVTLMVNKGYSSASAMYEAAGRFKGHGRDRSVLFYLGDHDPMAVDVVMVRDIRTRLVEFGADEDTLNVTKLALTRDQIQEFNPPPNPVKMTDSRAGAYTDAHKSECWEVDALPPDQLARIIREAFQDVVDTDLMDEIKAKEETLKVKLVAAASKL